MQTETIEIPDLARAEARLPRWMVLCGVVALIAMLLYRQVMIAARLWLGRRTGNLKLLLAARGGGGVSNAGQARIPRLLVAKFLIRYPLAFGVVIFFFKTRWLPPMAILAGLFVPVAGLLIEAIVQIGGGLASHPSAPPY